MKKNSTTLMNLSLFSLWADKEGPVTRLCSRARGLVQALALLPAGRVAGGKGSFRIST